ncbi:MAG: HD domain-containing protein [Clostridiales bacterium]|nr:HD domain-containing protein [Clostridiales bacterium]
MKQSEFCAIEKYMQECMQDSAHDKEHVYRVLYSALDIAKTETGVDYDVLITACLLHDIGRKEQFENGALDHAEVGGDKAYAFLTGRGFSAEFAEKVKSCIVTHRFRKSNPPKSVEAKILFDADKLDVTGAMGVARTLVYKGGINDPLYSLKSDGTVSDGDGDEASSFFQEYHFKLKNVYSRFFTKRGEQIAKKRKRAADDFYNSLYAETTEAYGGARLLDRLLDGDDEEH